jgi:hypothetical protein
MKKRHLWKDKAYFSGKGEYAVAEKDDILAKTKTHD